VKADEQRGGSLEVIGNRGEILKEALAPQE
jgi:hypothetical protein